MIKDSDHLQAVLVRIGSDLQDVEDYLAENQGHLASFQFPKRVLRHPGDFKGRFRWIQNAIVVENLSRNLVFADVLIWIVMRSGIKSPAKDMTIKHIIALMGSVAETLINMAFMQRKVKREGFKKNTQRLFDDQVIDATTQSELDWLWAIRGGIHVFEMDQLEDHTVYGARDSRRAIKAVRSLTRSLGSAFNMPEVIRPTAAVTRARKRLKRKRIKSSIVKAH